MKTLLLAVLSLLVTMAPTVTASPPLGTGTPKPAEVAAPEPTSLITDEQFAAQADAAVRLFSKADEPRIRAEGQRLMLIFDKAGDPVVQSAEYGTILVLLSARNLGLLNPPLQQTPRRAAAPDSNVQLEPAPGGARDFHPHGTNGARADADQRWAEQQRQVAAQAQAAEIRRIADELARLRR